MLFFWLYLFCLIIIGEVCARKRIKNLDDFLLAGRHHGILISSGSLTATVIGAGSTIGAAGAAYYVGVSAAWYLLSACIGLFILAFTLAPALRSMSLYTIPEFMGKRYGARAKLLASFLSIIGLLLFLAAQFYAIGAILHQLTAIQIRLAIVLAAFLVIFYTLRGGAWAVHLSDNLQLVLIVLGVLLLCIFGLKEIWGQHTLDYPPLAKGFEDMGHHWFHPTLEKRVKAWDIFGLGTTILGWIIMSTTWHFTMQSTAQRFLSTKDVKTAKISCLISILLLLPIAFSVALVGMIARLIYPHLPPATGIAQGQALIVLVNTVLPDISGGLLLAALVAIIMSTCDSALLGASTIFLKDIYPRVNIRLLTLCLGSMATTGAILWPRLIQLLEWTAAIYCIGLFAPLILGLYWKKASEKSALAAMVLSGIIGGLWRILEIEQMSGIHFLIPALIFSFIIMVIFK